jgi:hypothetical protein
VTTDARVEVQVKVTTALLLAACGAAPVAPAQPATPPAAPTPRAPSAFERCTGEHEDASAFARLAAEDAALAEAEAAIAAKRAEEAVQPLRGLAFYSAAHAIALRASLQYLEAVNQIATIRQRPACYDEIAEATPVLIDRHCSAERSPPADEGACAILASVVCDVASLRERGETDYRAAAEENMALWRRFGEPRVRQGKAPWCPRMDEIVYNAMRAFRASHDEEGEAAAKAILHRGWPGMRPRRWQ